MRVEGDFVQLLIQRYFHLGWRNSSRCWRTQQEVNRNSETTRNVSVDLIAQIFPSIEIPINFACDSNPQCTKIIRTSQRRSIEIISRNRTTSSSCANDSGGTKCQGKNDYGFATVRTSNCLEAVRMFTKKIF